MFRLLGIRGTSMKGLLILLAVFVLIPVCMGLVSSYRAGVLPYQIRRSERRRKLLEQIEKGHIKPPKTFTEAWEDDYMGRSWYVQKWHLDTGHHHNHCGVGGTVDMKHYTKPINRLIQKVQQRWEAVCLWYLNLQITNRFVCAWHWHPFKWVIRLGVFAFIGLIIWAV